MSTKVKAFIGITVSFVVLIILFASNGGFRAARAADKAAAHKMKKNCSVAEPGIAEKVELSENIAQVETK